MTKVVTVKFVVEIEDLSVDVVDHVRDVFSGDYDVYNMVSDAEISVGDE